MQYSVVNYETALEDNFVKNFSATQEAERFDAEYFQPKYEEIIEAVKKYRGGFDALRNFIKTGKLNLVK